MHASLHVCACSRLDGVKIYVRVHSESLKQPWDWSGSSKKARTWLKCWTMLNCWVLAWSANFRQTPATKLSQFWCLLPLHCSLCSCCSGVCKSTTINPWPESILSKIQNTSKYLCKCRVHGHATTATELRFGSIWHGLDRLLPGWLVCFFGHNAVEHDVIFLAMYDVQRNKGIKRNQQDTNWTFKNQHA